jgi:hypothetical protein
VLGEECLIDMLLLAMTGGRTATGVGQRWWMLVVKEEDGAMALELIFVVSSRCGAAGHEVRHA